MTQYLLTIQQPDGPPPPGLEQIMADLAAVNRELEAAGVLVFTGGLHAPGTATVARLRDDGMLFTDGPYVESKEHVGGLYIINAADSDEARSWAEKFARATTLPIEVRAFRLAPG